MKSKFYISLAVVAILAGTGCQDLKFGDAFLEKPPSSEVDINTIYGDAAYARRALWAAYRTLPYGLPHDEGTCMFDDILECLTKTLLDTFFLAVLFDVRGKVVVDVLVDTLNQSRDHLADSTSEFSGSK